MNRKVAKNVITGFGGQLIIIVLGIIIPRMMIGSYGSDVNGLLSTVGQIFTYMALLEAGIGQAARNALYKPMSEKNHEGISYVVSVAQRYYSKVTIWYGIAVIILAAVAPLLIKTNVDYWTVAVIVLFEGMSGVINFYFVQTKTTVLAVDGKSYIINEINVVNKVVSYSAKIGLAAFGINIVFLQLVYFIITVAKLIFYQIYFKSHYSWIDYNAAPKTAKLKDRNAYIITEIAWTMFSSTDMIVLSMFVNTTASSIYGVYNMIFSNINVLLNTVYMSVNYMLGQTYYKDREKYIQLHDSFSSIFFGAMTAFMSVAYILIIPFIRLYTKGIADADYINPSLPLMFCLVQMISWSRYIPGNLTAVAGFVKQVSRISLVEAIINITFSVILVRKYGITGVLFATVIALPLKVVYCIYLSDKVILKRSVMKTILILGANYTVFVIAIIFEKMVSINIESWFGFLGMGLLLTSIFLILGAVLNMLVNRECLKIAKTWLKKK